MSRYARLATWARERHEESHAQFAASGGFRQHWKQSGIDYVMTGAEERDSCPYAGTVAVYRGTWSSGVCQLQNLPRTDMPLSAQWWHG